MSGHGDGGESSKDSVVTQDQNNRAKGWWHLGSQTRGKNGIQQFERYEGMGDGWTRFDQLPEDHPAVVADKVSVI